MLYSALRITLGEVSTSPVVLLHKDILKLLTIDGDYSGGPVGAPAGAITASLMCTLLQFAVNEAAVFRVRYVSKRLQQSSEPIPVSSEGPTSPIHAENVLTTPPSSTTIRSPTPALPHEPISSYPSSNPPGRSTPLSERLLALIGVKKMSDEEYLERLRKRRDGYLKRIEELEEQERRRGDDEGSS